MDGILRGLGGLYAGAFTTTQRNALAVADRPTGLIILNTTTARLEINMGTDVTPNWQPVSSALAADSVTAVELAPGAVTSTEMAAGHGRASDYGTAFPTTGLFNGYRFTLIVDGDKAWDFIYRADVDGTHPWFFRGGAPVVNGDGSLVHASASVSSSIAGTNFNVPRAGYYRAGFGGTASVGSGGQNIWLYRAGSPMDVADRGTPGNVQGVMWFESLEFLCAANDEIAIRVQNGDATSTSYAKLRTVIHPVKLA